MFEGLLLPWQQDLPSCFFIQFLENLLKFLVNFTLLKYVKSQRNYGFLITKELIFGFQILDLKDHFLASLTSCKMFIEGIPELTSYREINEMLIQIIAIHSLFKLF